MPSTPARGGDGSTRSGRFRVSLAMLAVAAGSAAGASGAAADAVDLCGYSAELCGLSSFSGLMPIPDVGALFYWYFEPLRADPGAPLILWLQGGPGSSSMIGNLFELGPVTLDEHAQLRLRSAAGSWSTNFPVVFVDSPVGTGFSYAVDDSTYARNETEVASALASFLKQFKALHPELSDRLVIAGESYGGHYVPALGRHLIDHPGPFKVDAILVGDGLTDPDKQVLQKPLAAMGFGLIDERQLREAKEYAQQSHDLVVAGKWDAAQRARSQMEDVVTRASQVNLFDIRITESYDWQDARMGAFFGRDSTKDLLHVPRGRSFHKGDRVGQGLKEDVMRSFKGHVENVLQAGVQVLLYQGQFDWKDGVWDNEAWIGTMTKWDGLAGYLEAPREIWRRAVDGKIAGYWRRFRNLHQVVVRDAGHMVPMDQPLSAADMLERFVGRTIGQDTRVADTPAGLVIYS